MVVMVGEVVVAVAMEDMAPRTKRIRTSRPGTNTNGGAMLNVKLVCWALGLWGASMFVSCVVYGLVTPQSLHMHEFLEQVLPAFKWLTWWGFLLGLVESFLYGVYAGLVYVPIYNFLKRRWGTA